MRTVLIALVLALAPASVASAQISSEWKVDVAKYGVPPIFYGTTPLVPAPTTDFATVMLGKTALTPSLVVGRDLGYWTTPRDPIVEMDTYAVGFTASGPSHPRLAFIGNYFYRQMVRHQADKEDPRMNFMHALDMPHETKYTFGFRCSFPLTSCLAGK